MDASQYIQNLANMAGIDPTNENLQEIIGNESLQSIDINDDLANTISGNLMTMDSAKANSDLNKHFRATILNGLDAETNNLMESFGLPDDVRSTINAEQSSFKKVGLLANQIKELESSKSGASNDDTKKLNETIAQLNDQIVGLKSSHDESIATINETWTGKMLQSKVSTILSGYNYALPVSTETNVLTAQTLVNQSLERDGLQINDVNGGLALLNRENQPHYVQNTIVDVKSYIDNVLGTHKLLKVSDNSTQSNGTPPPTSPPPTNDGGFAGAVQNMMSDLK